MSDEVKILHSQEYITAAEELSKYIASLPISEEQNDQLIKLTVAQTHAAEQGSFKQGFGMGLEVGRMYDIAEEPVQGLPC